MSLINTRILPRNFELIRDRIGAILADEISNQASRFGDSDLSRTIVWNSRNIPFDKTDIPAVNVNLYRGDYVQWDVEQSTGIFKYSIDVWGSAKTNVTQNEMGDKKASLIMQKILGVCQAILDDPQYRTLAFAPPSLERTFFEALDIANPVGHDAESAILGRLIFNVKVSDVNQLLIAPMIKGYDTMVKMELTDLGYYYKVDNY